MQIAIMPGFLSVYTQMLCSYGTLCIKLAYKPVMQRHSSTRYLSSVTPSTGTDLPQMVAGCLQQEKDVVSYFRVFFGLHPT